MRRLFWALVGIGFGAVVGVGALRWAERTRQAMTPASLAGRAEAALGELAGRVGEAVSVGRAAMAARETELRADLERSRHLRTDPGPGPQPPARTGAERHPDPDPPAPRRTGRDAERR